MATGIILKKIADNKVAVAVIAVVLLLLAYYFLFKKNKGGILGLGAVQTDDTDINTIANVDKDIKQLSQKTIPSYTDSQYQTFAESIYQALRYSGIDDKKDEAARILMTMESDLDILKLVKAFGSRQEFYFGVPAGGKKTLPAFVTTNMNGGLWSKQWVKVINENYANKGIKFRF